MTKLSDKNQKDETYYTLCRPEMIQFLPKEVSKMKVLEIGCGAGNFKNTVGNSLEYWGVEPNEEIACRAELSLTRVLIGTFEDVFDQLPKSYFDLVVCNDVIEHMQDVDGFLLNIKRVLSDGALIIGSIPNVRYVENIMRFLVQRDWKYTNWGILDKTHLRFFTMKSLFRTFSENGYQYINVKGINPVHLKYGSVKSFTLNLILLVGAIIFGSDSKYYQLGFVISPKKLTLC